MRYTNRLPCSNKCRGRFLENLRYEFNKFTNINADGVCGERWSGEMWVGVTLAVVVEVVPVPLRTSAVAVYMLIISNIGGSMPLLVPVLKTAFQDLGYDPVSSLRGMKPGSPLCLIPVVF